MRLFLVDSSIFVFRAWFGPDPGRASASGEPNQAFVGFSDFVYRLLSEQAPSRVVFAFDESLAKSARKQIYPEYKANRAPAPAELKRQFGWCREWLAALGIACVSSSDWEADDLIGSLARFHRRPELPLAICGGLTSTTAGSITARSAKSSASGPSRLPSSSRSAATRSTIFPEFPGSDPRPRCAC